MFQYANDHDGKYPDGNSSTEIFQKLIADGYISDLDIFYIPLAGKTKPVPGQKLKPENICWDVTSGLDFNSPDELPVVFLTGYRVNYVPGGSAIPLVKPYPRFGWVDSNQTWFDWLLGRQTIHYDSSGGIAVTYKSNSAKFMKLNTTANTDGSVPDFIPPDFKPDG